MDVKSVYQKIGREKKGRYDPPWIIQIKDRQRDAILHFIESAGSQKILDVGCGSGRYLVPLCKKGNKVTGVDFSNEMIQVAKGFLNKEKLRANFMIADIRKLPKDLKDFDVVLCIDMLHHLSKKDRSTAIKNLARVLRKGGLLIVDVKNKLNPYYFIQQHILFPYYKVPEISVSYSVYEIEKVAMEANCRLFMKRPSVLPFAFFDPLVTCFFIKE